MIRGNIGTNQTVQADVFHANNGLLQLQQMMSGFIIIEGGQMIFQGFLTDQFGSMREYVFKGEKGQFKKDLDII